MNLEKKQNSPRVSPSLPQRPAAGILPRGRPFPRRGVENPTYTIRTSPAAGGAVTTLVAGPGNDGTFIATAATVYYETWTQTNDSTTRVLTRSGAESGIVGVDGTVVQAPLANSTFVNGGEQQPWPDDTVTPATPYETLFQVTGLTPVTVTNTATGYQYVEDGVSGGTVVAIDATSNQPGPGVGTLPVSTAVTLSGTFRDGGHNGFLEAANAISTGDPATRDLYILNSQTVSSLTRVTNAFEWRGRTAAPRPACAKWSGPKPRESTMQNRVV